MAMQEFLASYAVEVDEAGVKRLQEALKTNRELAEALAGAFDAARDSLKSLDSSLDALNIRTGLREKLQLSDLQAPDLHAELDLSEATSAAESWVAQVEALRPKLKVNTSGMTTAVSSAVSSIRSMLSALSITVPVRAVVTLDPSGLPDEDTGSGRDSGWAGDFGGSDKSGGSDYPRGSGFPKEKNGMDSEETPAISETFPDAGVFALHPAELIKSDAAGVSSDHSSADLLPAFNDSEPIPVPAFGDGGRVDSPTFAMIGEENEPEYVIPVKKEEQAVPLVRELLSEMSEPAKESLIRAEENEPEKEIEADQEGVSSVRESLVSEELALPVTDLFNQEPTETSPVSNVESVPAENRSVTGSANSSETSDSLTDETPS